MLYDRSMAAVSSSYSFSSSQSTYATYRAIAEYDAKRTLNTTQAGQQYDESGQLVTVAR